MTSFRWVDRHGVAHDIVDADVIEREYWDVVAEVRTLGSDVSGADETVTLAALAKAAPLRARLTILVEDLRRHLRHTADDAIRAIGEITGEAAYLAALHRCYDQQAERIADTAWLAGPPSAEQVSVLARALTSPLQATSFREAHALLVANAGTCRTPLPDDVAAVEWTDRLGHWHQVRDLRQIEREYLTVAAELGRLLPRLATGVPIRDVLAALDAARLGVRRVSVIERSMNHWTAQVIVAARDEYAAFLGDLET